MAYNGNPAEAKKEEVWIGCVNLHLEYLRTQRMAETGKDGTTIAEAHADLYQRGRGLFERFYNPNGDNEDIYVNIARSLPKTPLFSPTIPISAKDTRVVEEQLKGLDLATVIGHKTSHFPAVRIPKQ
jgi:hypothetical protein